MSNSRPCLLIIYPSAGIDTNATMSFLLETLARRNVQADVLLGQREDFLLPESFGDTIHMEYLPGTFFDVPHSTPKRLIRHILKMMLYPQSYSWFWSVDPIIFRLLKARQYSAILGVDPHGITLADYINKWVKRPLIYISFEIMFAEEMTSTSEETLRHLEQIACERVSLVLIQDDERASVFCREKSFPREKVIMVPVAPPPQAVVKSDCLRKRLGIPPEKRIVLYSGALTDWASRDELAEMVSYWPDGLCLVVHTRSMNDARTKRYLRQLSETGKIYVSSEPIPRRDLVALIASADFGLAPYKPVPTHWLTDNNIYYLGLSSGKVSYYAMCGLPILARSLPVFDREFANYRCGKVYRRVAETGQMLEEMERDYAHYSAEARRFYQERLNPVEGMHRFCDKLMGLAGIG